MTLTKDKISKKIAVILSISKGEAKDFTNVFFEALKSNCDSLKLSKFATFKKKFTVERLGRNPKNKKIYVIPSYKKLYFKPSNSIKRTLN
jgi:nucleoid DNA-binding protein